VGRVLPCRVPVSRGICFSSCLSLVLTFSLLCLPFSKELSRTAEAMVDAELRTHPLYWLYVRILGTVLYVRTHAGRYVYSYVSIICILSMYVCNSNLLT